MKHWHRVAGIALVAMALAGCSPAQRTEARNEARDTGSRIVEGGREAIQDARQAAKHAGLGAKVKTALGLRSGLDVRRIDVEADARTGTVRLEGSVPNMQQFALAEEVARQTDGVNTVVNRLAVPPAAAGSGQRGG